MQLHQVQLLELNMSIIAVFTEVPVYYSENITVRI